MSAWKPIETAPKDGTRIILRRPLDYADRHAIGYYHRYWEEWTPIHSNSEFVGATEWMEIPE